jgi:AcrR family transcriptional regulator
MQAIAEAAGVAPRTVFLAFPTKAALLMEIIQVSVRGDDDELALADRRAWQQMLTLEPEPMLHRFAELSTDLLIRAARWLALGDAAADADAEVAALGEEGRRRMRADVTGVVRALSEQGALAPGLTEADAVDTLTALPSHLVYLRLTADRRWSRKRYAQWLSRLLIRTLLNHHHDP